MREVLCRNALLPLVAMAWTTVALPATTAQAQDSASEAAMAALKVAGHYYGKGDFKPAAERYHEAYRIDPNAAFLFNAARAEMRGFMLDDAERDFRRYLEVSQDAEGTHRARVHLDEIAAYRKQLALKAPAGGQGASSAAKPAPAPDQPTAASSASPPDQPPAPQTTPGVVQPEAPNSGWTTTDTVLAGSAAAMWIAGGFLYGLAVAQRSDALDIERGIGDVAAADLDARVKEHADLVSSSSRRRWTAVGLGVAGAGLGAYVLLRGRDSGPAAAWQLSPAADMRGAVFTGRF